MAAIELFSGSLYNDASLQSYYRFEADSTDTKGLNTGTDTSMTYGAGKFNNGAIFNGTTGFCSIGTSKFNHTTMSIVFWLVNKGTDKTADLIARNPDADQWANLGIAMVGSYLYLATNAGAVVNKRVMAYSALTSGDHLAFILNSDGTAIVYQNGTVVTPTDALTGFGAWNNNITNTLSFGRNGAYNNYYFDGKLDDLAFFSKALSADEVKYLYDNTPIPVAASTEQGYSYFM